MRGLAETHIIDGIAQRRHCCGKKEHHLARRVIVTADLRQHFLAVFVKHTQSFWLSRHGESGFDNIGALERKRVVNNYGHTLCLSVHCSDNVAGCGLQQVGQRLVDQHIVVHRVEVGIRDAGSCDTIVVSLPQVAHPGIVDGRLRIGLHT